MVKGHHEPAKHREAGKVMCPNWVRSEMAKLLNDLDGANADVMVAGVALLGENGFDVLIREQATEFDPAVYGLQMLEGINMLAGQMLGKVLDTVHASTEHPEHFTQAIEDQADRLQEFRNIYEAAVRQFLEGVLTYAGAAFQQGKKGGLSVAAGSQMINVWHHVAKSRLKFEKKEPPKEGVDDGGRPEEGRSGE